MLEQEQTPLSADPHTLLPSRPNDNTGAMLPQHTSQEALDPLDSLQSLIRAHFSDLTCSSTISTNGSSILTIWQQPNQQSTKGLMMKDLPLFYIVGSINENLKLCLRLITFHGKVVSELHDDVNNPIEDNTKISFVDRLTRVQLCQGVKILDPTLKLDPQTFTFLYLVEQLDQNVIVRSRQCQFALQEGKLVCEVCEALNETATNKKPIIRPDGGLFPISGMGNESGTIGEATEDVKPLLLPQVNFSESLDEDPLKGNIVLYCCIILVLYPFGANM